MRLLLLGDPVDHSRSPAIHRAALRHLDIPGSYDARRVDASGMRAAADEIRSGAVDGANVTMPHKVLAASLCDALTADAAFAGAVNTMALRDGVLTGWNTDVIALRALLADMPGDPVLVLGAGAAAASAVAAVVDRPVEVTARRTAAAARLGRPAPWGMPRPGALVVNATPLGMRGEPLPKGIVRAAAGLVDLAYGRTPTPASVEAGLLGLPCVDGLQVLVAQAAESFRIWTGREAPVEVMERAARS